MTQKSNKEVLFQTRGLFVSTAILAAMLVAFPLPTIVSSDNSGSFKAAIIVGLSLIAIWMVFRWGRCGVIVGPERVIVRNPFRSFSVPWDEIRTFGWRRRLLVSKASVELRDGRIILIAGLPVGGQGLGNSSTAKALKELNHRLDAKRDRPENLYDPKA